MNTHALDLNILNSGETQQIEIRRIFTPVEVPLDQNPFGVKIKEWIYSMIFLLISLLQVCNSVCASLMLARKRIW